MSTLSLPDESHKPTHPQTMRHVKHPLTANYLSTKQLAEVLSASVSAIKESRMSGLLFGRTAPEFIRIGDRKIVYEASEIVRWVNAGKRGRISGAER